MSILYTYDYFYIVLYKNETIPLLFISISKLVL